MNYLIGLSINKIISEYTNFSFDASVKECIVIYIMPIVYHIGTMGTNTELISWTTDTLSNPPNPDLIRFISRNPSIQENKKVIIEHIIRYIINVAMLIASFNKRQSIYFTDIIVANTDNINLSRISLSRRNLIQ
jgi:hypothetical protein